MRGALFFSSRYGSTERVSQWIVRRITCAETYLYQIDKLSNRLYQMLRANATSSPQTCLSLSKVYIEAGTCCAKR